MEKHKVDGDLKKIQGFIAGAKKQNTALASLGLSVVFLVAILLYAGFEHGTAGTGILVVAAAVVGAYMAMNIGANDVASNIGPAVGSRTFTLAGALLIAIIFEAAGVIVAGDDVISTIRKGIIRPAAIMDQMIFSWAMMSAFLAAALWFNLATWVGVSVSAVHSIVGGVIGAGVAAVGASSVAWGTLGMIAASWVITPIVCGIIAAALVYFVTHRILMQKDKLEAARIWIPVLVGVMAGAFSMYLAMKGLKELWKPNTALVWLITAGSFATAWTITKPFVAKATIGLENRKGSVAKLFTIPLIFSAALLSFAHGANDVATIVGPLAAIASVAGDIDILGGDKTALPFWVFVIGAVSISAGLLLFGPKLLRTAGDKLIKLNQMRAFCVALAAAVTVIAASWLGLPVSSTHIALGGIFGVGFLREYLERQSKSQKARSAETLKEKQKLDKLKLVRRREMQAIVTAWVTTVPVAGLLSAGLFFILHSSFSS